MLVKSAIAHLDSQALHQKKSAPGVSGLARWSFNDQTRGANSQPAYWGVVDQARNKKFIYEACRSQGDPSICRDDIGGPMVFIANYWTPESPKDVTVFSNCSEVELFLNGKTLGRKSPEPAPEVAHPPFVFKNLGFEPGELKAVGYLNGKKVAEAIRNTPEKSAKSLKIVIDDNGVPLRAKADSVFVRVMAVDAKGTVIPSFKGSAELTLKGDAQIVSESIRPFEEGVASFLIRFGDQGGAITLRACRTACSPSPARSSRTAEANNSETPPLMQPALALISNPLLLPVVALRRRKMKQRVASMAALLAATAAAFAAENVSAEHWTKPYNIVWTTPGTKGYDSMPAGGGNISLNVWAEKDDLVFYIGSSDSFNAAETLTKLARIRVKVSPNPFAENLRQELDLESNTVLVSGRTTDGAEVRLRVRADAHQPVVHVEGTATKPVEVTATLELENGWQMTAKPAGAGILWSRRVPAPSVYRANMIKGWGIEPIADKVPDPLGNLTCGGLLTGTGFVAAELGQSFSIRTVAPAESFALRAVLRLAQDDTQEAWETAVGRLAEATKETLDADGRKSADWWRAFWDRSRIVINPDANNPGDQPWQAGRNYQLFRAMLAANANGKFPTFFNGGAFTCGGNPDGRAWGGCKFMAQNQRLLYWPLLKSGDADLLGVGTGFYARTAELQRMRIREKFGVEGVIYDESLNTMGLGCFPNKDGFNNYRHLRYHFTSGLEFVFMMLEARRYFGEDIKPCLPAIEGALRFFDSFYRRENKSRTGKELDDQGRLVIYPGNALELYDDTRNGSDALAGLMAISDGLLALPAGEIPADTRAWVEAFHKSLPPIATRQLRGHTVIAPAASWGHEGGQANAELPQLYPVFPFHVYGVGKPELQLARDTWWYGGRDESLKTVYCWFQGNIFVADLGLTEEARRYALSKLLFPADFGVTHNPWKTPITPPRTRFPAFWDTPLTFCEVPDMDHGGSAMVGLQEMLLQTDGKKIQLFPAWPKDWDVDFKLHAPFQTTVEARFRKGKIEKLVVTPSSRAADIVDLSGVEPPPLPPKPLDPKDGLCVGKTASASSIYSKDYGPENAMDGDPKTRWAVKTGSTSGWLEVDLGQSTRIGRALISEIEWKETRAFVIEAKEGDTWKELARGTTIGADLFIEFPPVTARIVRLRIVECKRDANINEFQLFAPANECGTCQPCTLRNPWPGKKVQVARDGKPVETLAGDLVKFAIRAGDAFTLRPE